MLLNYVKELYRRYREDEVPAYSAEMAYYFLLSVFPFLIFITTVIGYLPIPKDSIMQSLASLLPHESYIVIRQNVEQVIKVRNLKLLSLGFISMLWAAASGMGAVMRGINKALCQRDTRPFWIAVPLAVLFTVLVAVLIIIYFALLIFGRHIGGYLIEVGLLESYWMGWDILRYLSAVLIMILVFVLLYRYSPCIKIRWRNAMPGAVFTTIGWLVISWLFAWYVNRFWHLSLVYGRIGGIIALLVWMFISAQLILLGGEVNALLIFSRRTKNTVKRKRI